MPKAKNTLAPEEQRKRFEAEVKKRIAGGELDPAKANEALDTLVTKQRPS